MVGAGGTAPGGAHRAAPPAPQVVLGTLWAGVALGAGGVAFLGDRQLGAGPASLAVLAGGVALAAALVWALPGPALRGEERPTERLRLAVAVAIAVLFLLGLAAGGSSVWQVLSVVVLAQAATLAVLRTFGSRREVAYALALAAVAGVAGLGALRNAPHMAMPAWAAFQFALTFLGLTAGWAAGRRVGLTDRGLGRVVLIEAGWRPALAALVWGLGLAVPFALVSVALGSAETERWIGEWWQPLVALQPGIAEEAWARVFLLSALALVFARWTSFRGAWLAAILVGVPWFAYLHVSPGDVASTALIAVLFNVPLTVVWLRRGLESAIGFHVMMDGLRWAVSFLVVSGILAR